MGKNKIVKVLRAVTFSAAGLGIMSASNFALSVILIRTMPLSEFGLYGIGYAAILLYSSVGQALFLSQMVANAPDKAASGKEPYAAAVFAGVLGLSMATIGALALASCVGAVFSRGVRDLLGLIFAFCAFGIAHQIKDYFVTYSYMFRREHVVVGINIVFAIALFSQLGVLYFRKIPLTVELVALIYAASLVAGAAVGFLVFRINVTRVKLTDLVETVVESWGNGRWALLGVMVSWLQSQAYVTISAIMLGPASVGLANASRLLIVPFSLFANSVGQVVVPRLSDLRVSDRERVPVMGRLFVVVLTCCAALYIATLYFAVDLVSGMLFKEDYAAALPLVWIWCGTLLVGPLRTGGVVVLQAFKHFRGLTIDYAISAIATVVVVAILIKLVGVGGAILGLALGDGFVGWLLWRRVHRTRGAPSE